MKKGFVASCFDLGPHAGHMVMLEEAKKHCDYLIVGLHIDPSIERPSKNKPVQSVSERYIVLKGCKYVDEIIPYQTESELLSLLQLISLDVRFLGSEYKERSFTGSDLGIPLQYIERNHEISSSRTRRLIYEAEKAKIEKKQDVRCSPPGWVYREDFQKKFQDEKKAAEEQCQAGSKQSSDGSLNYLGTKIVPLTGVPENFLLLVKDPKTDTQIWAQKELVLKPSNGRSNSGTRKGNGKKR